MSLLQKQSVLKVNKNWLALRPEALYKVYVDMAKDTVRAVDIEYKQFENGDLDYSSPIKVSPVSWEEWIELPIRPQDSFVRTPHKRIRVPTVVVCTHYSKVPMKRIRCTARNIFERDDYTCGYTGRKLHPSEATVDHILAKSRGGKSTWDNQITCDRRINQQKADKTLEECGLSLLKRPKTPLPIPATAAIKNIVHPDWVLFLLK